MIKRNKNAFTLIEILIVVAIIAVLIIIAVPNVVRARKNTNESLAQASLKLVSNALENYVAANGIYPPQTTDLVTVDPPYLEVDYFTGVHAGYSFTSVLSNYSYTVTATPIAPSAASVTYTMTTGGIISSNN
ncbi:MAG: type IV pilin protein [Candidatus Omnitrophica bacterium]|nr:type IV pilin protein [Candidatus Omnitrophota bacterium]